MNGIEPIWYGEGMEGRDGKGRGKLTNPRLRRDDLRWDTNFFLGGRVLDGSSDMEGEGLGWLEIIGPGSITERGRGFGIVRGLTSSNGSDDL